MHVGTLGNSLDTVFGDPSASGADYSQAIADIAPNLPTTIAASNDGSTPWYVTAGNIVNTLLMTDQQKQLLDIQVKRAAAGLPPLDTSGYSGLGVNVGVAQGTQNMVLMLGALIAGAVVLPKLIGGRRARR